MIPDFLTKIPDPMPCDTTSQSAAPGDDTVSRRTFLQRSAMGVAAMSLGMQPGAPKSQRMGIVVHSYASRWNSKTPSSKYPGFANALDLFEHCHQIGAGGMQTTVRDWTPAVAKKLRNQREKWDMYLEGSIGLPKGADDIGRFESEVKNAKETGAAVLRTVCMNGRRYESLHSKEDFEKFRKDAILSLELAEKVMRQHKVKLAVENHKDWRANELAHVLKNLSSEWVGVTLDFGNSIALLEDPMHVVQTLAPFVMSTHVKDMGVEEYGDGFLLSEVPLGQGILDLAKIVSICRAANPDVTFNLEMITRDPLEIPCLRKTYWPTMDETKGNEVADTLRMVREKKPKEQLPKVTQLSPEERLAVEEHNILSSLQYSQKTLGLT
jgi:3-oxoisoapionate decarboxylase